MKTAFKLFLLIGLLYAGSQFYQKTLEYRKEQEKDPNRESDVIDGLIGREAVDQYTRIKEMKDQFNVPALKTTLVMFQTQHGRYPRSMQELAQSGNANRDITHDRFGNPYQIQIRDNRHVLLQSAGRDRIQGTTDDVKHTFDL